MYLHCSGAGTGGAGGATGPPIFCRSFNPIRTREVRLSPTITTGPPNVFHLLASLFIVLGDHREPPKHWPP